MACKPKYNFINLDWKIGSKVNNFTNYTNFHDENVSLEDYISIYVGSNNSTYYDHLYTFIYHLYTSPATTR